MRQTKVKQDCTDEGDFKIKFQSRKLLILPSISLHSLVGKLKAILSDKLDDKNMKTDNNASDSEWNPEIVSFRSK